MKVATVNCSAEAFSPISINVLRANAMPPKIIRIFMKSSSSLEFQDSKGTEIT
jgi:hypothetical protein